MKKFMETKERILNEIADIENRIGLLQDFTKTEEFNDISYAHKRLIFEQLDIMAKYSDVLRSRYSIFGVEENE